MIPKIAIGMPSYDGTARIAAARAVLTSATIPTDPPTLEIASVMDASGSLLPHIFNHLIAQAFADRDAGEVTHFAMLHGDIHPADGWLDVLWHEMQRTGSTAIAAVVPMKEAVENPKTSTAVGSQSNPWQPVKHYHLNDRHRLPITFGDEEVKQDHGEDALLLINTGCMLLDIQDEALWEGFAFNFKDRIIKQEGMYKPQVRPEDWEMSRFLQNRGARVQATWAVNLEHHGQAAWPSGPTRQMKHQTAG